MNNHNHVPLFADPVALRHHVGFPARMSKVFKNRMPVGTVHDWVLRSVSNQVHCWVNYNGYQLPCYGLVLENSQGIVVSSQTHIAVDSAAVDVS